MSKDTKNIQDTKTSNDELLARIAELEAERDALKEARKSEKGKKVFKYKFSLKADVKAGDFDGQKMMIIKAIRLAQQESKQETVPAKLVIEKLDEVCQMIFDKPFYTTTVEKDGKSVVIKGKYKQTPAEVLDYYRNLDVPAALTGLIVSQ